MTLENHEFEKNIYDLCGREVSRCLKCDVAESDPIHAPAQPAGEPECVSDERLQHILEGRLPFNIEVKRMARELRTLRAQLAEQIKANHINSDSWRQRVDDLKARLAAASILMKEHDDDAVVQINTAQEIAIEIRALTKERKDEQTAS